MSKVTMLFFGIFLLIISGCNNSSTSHDNTSMNTVVVRIISDSRMLDTGKLPGYYDWVSREFPYGYRLRDGIVDLDQAKEIAYHIFSTVEWVDSGGVWKTSTDTTYSGEGNCRDLANAILIAWREAGFSDYNILVIYLVQGSRAHAIPAITMNGKIYMMDIGNLDSWTPVHCYNLEPNGGWKF